MTREEAVMTINFLKEDYEQLLTEEDAEALDMAIEALKAEQKRIPVTEILNYLDVELHPIISPEHWHVYSELHDMISSLPSADRLQTDIVHCEGCKHYDEGGYCWHPAAELGDTLATEPTDSCSYGERKGGMSNGV